MKQTEFDKLPLHIQNSIRLRNSNLMLTLLENVGIRNIVKVPKHNELIPMETTYIELFIN